MVRDHLCTLALPVVVVIFQLRRLHHGSAVCLPVHVHACSLEVHDSTVTSMRVNEILDRSVFTVDAAAKAHGEPTALLALDWNSLMVQFKAKFGSDFCEEELPAQSYFEV